MTNQISSADAESAPTGTLHESKGIARGDVTTAYQNYEWCTLVGTMVDESLKIHGKLGGNMGNWHHFHSLTVGAG